MTSTAELSFEFLLNTFDSIPDAVVLADSERKIIGVNEAFLKVFGYSIEEALGKKTAFIYATKKEFTATGKQVFHPGSNADAVMYEVEYRRKNGQTFIAETVASEVKSDTGDTIGFLGVIRDLTTEKRRNEELKLLTARLHALVEITTKGNESFDDQIDQILKVTTELLKLDVGIISEIHGDVYTVKYFYPESSGMYKEQSFRMGNTYCDITYKQDDIVAIHNMEKSEYNAHPCYQKFELEGYIGIPYEIAGERVGTINFSSLKPVPSPFSEADRDLIRIIAQWVGVLLHRKRIKEELIQSRNIYKIVSERASDIVCLLNPDGTAEYVSPSVETILGYSQEEFKEMHPMSLVHPADFGKTSKFLQTDFLKAKESDTITFQAKKKDGAYIWLENTYEVIKNSRGKVVALKSYSKDVTDAKKLERIYEQVEGIGQIGGWEFDLATNEIFWTQQVYKIFGTKKAVPFHVEEGLEFFPDREDKDEIVSTFQRCIDLGVARTVDVPFTSTFGELKFLRFKISAHSEKKLVTRLYGTVQDITEKKREENLFNDAQRMAQVGGWELEIESGRLFWTDEVYRIHELEVGAELKVEEGINFYDEEDGSRELISEVVANALETGESYDVQCTLVTALGNKKSVRAIGKTIIRNGKVVKMYGTFQDITEQKEKENELEQKNIELTEVNTMNHQLNSVIGHDLKSPLSSIIGLSDFMMFDLESDDPSKLNVGELRTNMGMILASSRNMAKILDDVFKWSRLQLNGISLNSEEFQLKTIIEATFEVLKPVADLKHIELISCCENDLVVTADKTLCPTVIRNFISNAIKFSKDWSSITLNCEKTTDYWSISVTDQGIGMSDEIKSRLFDPQNHPSQRGTHNEKGTGLGLRLSQKLAHLHGGEILVESEEGKGSTFTFKVPVNIPA